MTATTIAVLALVPQSIPVGPSQISVAIDGTELELYTYKPESYKGEKLILVFHGVNRNADTYRDNSKNMGDRFSALIVAPKFDTERFPSRKYQFGGILNADRSAAKPEEWTYALIPKLATEVRRIERNPELRYWIIGHSAGGQFVARMAAFQETGAERLVAANPGSHLFPTLSAPFGYGFGSLPGELSSDEVLKRYLAAPLTIYLGTADDKPDDNFDSSPNAMRQGEGRYQRGKACFAAAESLAKEKGWTFNWNIVEADGVAHDHAKMFDHPNCERALFNAK